MFVVTLCQNFTLLATFKDPLAMSSFSSETPSIYDVQSQRPTTRLRLAMQEHERLMAERSRAGSPCPSQLSMAPPQEKRPQTQATSIADLATQLQTLHQRAQKSTDGEKQAACSLGVRSFIEKIGQQEKDELLVHLLQQLTLAQNERKQVASLGEQMASQLVHQQVETTLRSQSHLLFRLRS